MIPEEGLFLVVLACAAANYLIRVSPHLIPGLTKAPVKLQKFLNLIPIAALGALILPGAIILVPGNPLPGLAGLGAALLVAWFRPGLILPVVVSVGVTYLFIQYII